MSVGVIPLIAVGVTVLAIFVGWRMRTSPVRTAVSPNARDGFLKTTRGRVTIFADQDLSPHAQRRVGVAVLAAGLLFLATLAVGVIVFLSR
jgi:hypothetical protein